MSQNNEDEFIEEIEQLDKFSRPIQLVKKAFSSLFVVIVISLGFIVNWILAVIFLFGYFSSVSWFWYISGLLLMLVIFPAIYIYFAYSYGKSVAFWQAYKETIRPLAAKVFSKTLDKFLVDGGESVNESEIIEEVEERKKHFLEKLPNFISAYFQIFFTSGDILKAVKAQRKSGVDKAVVKQKALRDFFKSLDLQMSELMEPSLIPFYIVGAVNLLCFYFLF